MIEVAALILTTRFLAGRNHDDTLRFEWDRSGLNAGGHAATVTTCVTAGVFVGGEEMMLVCCSLVLRTFLFKSLLS